MHLQPKGHAGNVHNEEAHMLTNWLEKGVFDALEKKYLRCVVFCITVPTEEGIDKVVETYQWQVTYNEDGEVLLNSSKMARTKDELKGQVCIA